jgi:hypothetical protein
MTHSRNHLTPALVLGATILGATTGLAACSSDDSGVVSARVPTALDAEVGSVTFAQNGKLGGGMAGWAWVAAGALATVDSPNPCDDSGCFKNTQSGLCTSGSLPALTCTTPESWDCNYDQNWGVVVGLNAQADGGTWGADAPQSVAVSYAGDPGNYWLTAHVAGDPQDKTYCIQAYPSGMAVRAEQLVSECWSSDGEPLPSFAVIDRLGLMLASAKTDVAFDYCVTGVTLNAPAETDRVLIGNHGKLSGPMTGYSWVAAGEAATIASPSPCDRSGCFRDTGGKLCLEASLPALQCTGHDTPEYKCDWATNWGAMIGMNPRDARSAWGERAASRVAVDYAGGPGTYQLTAHVAGDPKEQPYCLRNYQSGQAVTPEMLRTECWNDSGKALSSFADVDSFGLVLLSAETPVAVDFCIEAISAG